MRVRKKYLCIFLGVLPLYSGAALAIDGDANSGAAVFSAQCAICHSVKLGKNKIGPSLGGVVGRDAGSIANFVYSDAMKSSGVKWTPDNLDAYIANPQAKIPGVKMPYQGLPDAKARADLLAYLNSQNGQ